MLGCHPWDQAAPRDQASPRPRHPRDQASPGKADPPGKADLPGKADPLARQTPMLGDTFNKRAVCILLECNSCFKMCSQVARLAKYWNSTIICTESLFGRSYTFELLGIAAGRNEEEFRNKIGQKPSVSRAFRQFLKMVEDIGQQQIVFTYSEDFYSRSDTPDEVLKQKPLILDPSNPYNNVMSSFHGRNSVQQLFSDCAKETLRRLGNAERQIETGNDSLNLKEIFLPQIRTPYRPTNIPQMWSVEAQSGPP